MQSFMSIGVLAYFDPGSGSLLVQALVGGTAGLLVLAKYLWEMAPKLFGFRKSHDKVPAGKMIVGAGIKVNSDNRRAGF